MKLSTTITRMVVSDLFPGAHKQEQQEQGKGKGKGKGKQKPIDVKKIRKLKQFQKTLKEGKRRTAARRRIVRKTVQRLREKV